LTFADWQYAFIQKNACAKKYLPKFLHVKNIRSYLHRTYKRKQFLPMVKVTA